MRASFSRKPDPKAMVTENDRECAGEKFHGTIDFPCIDILCVDCGWTGHFADGSADHFHNHACKLKTESVSTSY